MSLSFIEASKIANADYTESDLPTKNFILITSCQSEKLELFIKANSIISGFIGEYSTIPFNTLQQFITSKPRPNKIHIFIVFPWDILPESDWRTGVTLSDLTYSESIEKIDSFIEKIKHFTNKHVLYIPAKILPLSLNYNLNSQIETQLHLSLLQNNIKILKSEYFSLSSYLSNGSAFSSKYLSDISSEVSNCLSSHNDSKKILITDLDNVMWNGVIGEDGIDGVQCNPESVGFIHYIYQSLLIKLKTQGVLIAAVTRNDKETALAPFIKNKTIFKTEDFVAVLASYNAKSSQIQKLLNEINLPLYSAVFIDDNPIELEEVQEKLKTISCIPFPTKNEYFPSFIKEIQQHFNLQEFTEDDKNRTEQYKSRSKAIEISTEKGADITEYLASLQMQLSIKKVDPTDFQRSMQLINKTNQFNLNGKRINEALITAMLQDGHSLYSFSLDDKFGYHGQIASIIISKENHIRFFVLSCRVFQREIEFAVVCWLSDNLKISEFSLDYLATEKNIPFQDFVNNKTFSTSNHETHLRLNSRSFVNAYKDKLNLFNIIVK